ncbi:ABC transporter ATP-binding protein [Vagococcus vulneris]|uniref:Multidrug ABC transporter ATP-binding protein n=1 Tax=Vagococcus vulneris TaxID=1977869 RepID=A0A429ZXY6_9ENTE|nr:ABC transporter ATP-binding protein [Vagococcus vulneris]RST98764.1 multidrug ABC transporter ATP-binding protein [Vagococcus vulneris]
MDIEVSQLIMKYGKHQVLDIPELMLSRRGAYGLVGKNGAGKTSFFKCLTNIITSYQGTIKLNGMDVRKHNELLTNVGIVLDGMSVYRDQTGWFNIDYFSRLRGEFNQQLAEQLALELEISEYLNQKVKTYSYGMIKKLILLIAILHQPKFLILDEPFRGLDSETVSWFRMYLKKLNSEGMTLIISSHIKEDIIQLCDTALVLEHGKIKEIIDLTSTDSILLRDIRTTNQPAFESLLNLADYPYQRVEDIVRLSISDNHWYEIKQRMAEEQIDIVEMIPVHALDDSLGKQGGVNR